MSNGELSIVGNLSDRYADNPLLQSLLHLIPGWSSADTLLQKRAIELKAERIRIFFDELAIGKIELNEELIASNNFLHCFFKTLQAAVNTNRKEKIRMFEK